LFYIYVMIDTWLYTWHDLVYDPITVCFSLPFIYTLFTISYFRNSIVICIHVDARAYSLLLHTHWEFSRSSGLVNLGLWLLHSFDQVFGEDDMHCEELVSTWLPVSLLLFIFVVPLILYILDSVFVLLLYHMLSCADICMYIAEIFIHHSDLYSLLRLF